MERCPVIKLNQIITDTIWLYSIYRIFKSGVKLLALKMLLCGNKKGQIYGSGSTPPNCDYFHTSLLFGVLDIYRIVGVVTTLQGAALYRKQPRSI